MNAEAASRKIIMVGAFPPPLHGMSAVNAAVRRDLEVQGFGPIVIDIAAGSLDRSWWARLGRLPRVLDGLGKFVWHARRGRNTLYISASGGFGQVYECLFLAIARLYKLRVFLHHHNYAYLDQPTRLARLLIWLAGPRSAHIVLSPGMGTKMRGVYPQVEKVVPLSNAGLLLTDTSDSSQFRTSLKTIGFLGNISAEKGVFDFLDVAEHALALDSSLQAELAGPFQDADTERQVRQRLTELQFVAYVGPRYGPDKAVFLEGIDVLLFPTRYRNEAEPLVVHEAMMHAVPVIAYGRGAIGELITPDCGLVVDPGKDFITPAIRQLEDWLRDPSAFQRASKAAYSRFYDLQNQGKQQWAVLSKEIGGGC